MERNPLGLQPAQYEAIRSDVLTKLDPRQKGVFRLLENLYELTQEGSQVTHEVFWHRGIETAQLLARVLKGDISALPIPGTYRRFNGYQRFSWRVTQFSGDYIDFFTFKLRLDEGSMQIFADHGDLHGVKGTVIKLTKDINYPITVEDEYGFNYENPAYITANLS